MSSTISTLHIGDGRKGKKIKIHFKKFTDDNSHNAQLVFQLELWISPLSSTISILHIGDGCKFISLKIHF